MRRHFDFSHVTQELSIVLLLSAFVAAASLAPMCEQLGILNQLEKTGKMWGFLSDCELPPKKKQDHKHVKRVGRKARETKAQNPLKANSSFL